MFDTRKVNAITYQIQETNMLSKKLCAPEGRCREVVKMLNLQIYTRALWSLQGHHGVMCLTINLKENTSQPWMGEPIFTKSETT